MLGSYIIVSSLPPSTNLISPHVVLWPASFCKADCPEFAASCCRCPWFQFQRWFCICLEIMSSPFLIKASATVHWIWSRENYFALYSEYQKSHNLIYTKAIKSWQPNQQDENMNYSNIAFILAQFWNTICFNFWLFQCFFLNHCCKHSNCEMPCHKCLL